MPERLGKDDCLPPGSINYDACHAKDAEEIARLRALLREAVLDRQAEMGDVCPSPCDHADCRWLREARKALEGREREDGSA